MVDTIPETGAAHVKVVARPRRGGPRPPAGPPRGKSAPPAAEAPAFEEPRVEPAPARTRSAGRTVVVTSATTPVAPLEAPPRSEPEEAAAEPAPAPRPARRARKPVAEDAAQAVAPPAEAPAPSRPRKDETVVVSSAATPVQPVVAPAPVITPVEELAAESERGTGPLRTFGVIVVAVVVAMFLNSTALLRSAEQMKPGAWRSVLLGVARPVDRIARDAHLTAPRHALDRALGRGGSQGSGPGLSDVPVSVPKGAAPVADGGSAPAASVPPPPTASTVTTAPTPPAFRPASLRPVDAHHPLKLWVTGDSQITYLGESLLAQTSDAGTVKSFVPDTHDGTGLVRPDNYDWLKASLAYIAKNKPDAVVITLGGNDYKQGIPAGPGKAWPAGSTGWAAAYQARAVAVMKALTGNGQRPVYWVTTPDIRDAAGNHAVQVLDQAVLAAAATVPGVVVVDARPVLSPDGKYHAYRGTTLIRAGDGLHATFAGSELVAKAVLAALNADWHLTK